MKRFYLYFAIIAFIASCSTDHSGAIQRLENSRRYLASQEFDKAKAELDSLKKQYPKSFEQRKAGMLLLDSIRKAENDFIIADMDTRLAEQLAIIDKLKNDFVFQKDEKYQEVGVFIPKNMANGVLSQTTLRVGVEEDGQIYLESIYIGGQKHNQMVASSGEFVAETLTVEADGLVHRFTNLGMSYEIIKFMGDAENNVIRFIAEHVNSNIKIQLKGQNTTSYILSKQLRESVKKASEFSDQILLFESYNAKKEEATMKNFYLDNNKQLTVPIVEE